MAWILGLEDESRSRYKLIVDCALIITSVVPPGLSQLMRLLSDYVRASHWVEFGCKYFSLATAKTRNILHRAFPYSVRWQGEINFHCFDSEVQVDVCCFDKTGTLTDEHLVLQGIAGTDPKSVNRLLSPSKAGQEESAFNAVMVSKLWFVTLFLIAGHWWLPFPHTLPKWHNWWPHGSGISSKVRLDLQLIKYRPRALWWEEIGPTYPSSLSF